MGHGRRQRTSSCALSGDSTRADTDGERRQSGRKERIEQVRSSANTTVRARPICGAWHATGSAGSLCGCDVAREGAARALNWLVRGAARPNREMKRELNPLFSPLFFFFTPLLRARHAQRALSHIQPSSTSEIQREIRTQHRAKKKKTARKTRTRPFFFCSANHAPLNPLSRSSLFTHGPTPSTAPPLQISHATITHHPIPSLLDERLQVFHLVGRPNKERHALVDLVRHDLQDPPRARAAQPARLLHDEGHRRALVQQA